jgi:hypothetical protein
MRTDLPMLKKNKLLFPTILVLVVSMCFISCVDADEPEFNYVAANLREDPKPFKLKKGQINWNQAERRAVDYLNFFTVYNRPKGEVEVYVQAYNATFNQVGKTMRLKKRNNNPIQFPSIGIDQNIIQIQDLPIIDGSGNLITFDSLQLTPTTYTDPRTGQQYLQYGIVIYSNGRETKEAVYTLPCPPCWNCKPREASCVDADARVTAPVDDPVTKPVVDTARIK